ncbi:MAG: hypothetical protein IJF84_14650 [Thermoguttaceae bacterium]|nr:hypothetical protein [Thermoguttaceae bacterium]
MTDYQGFSEQPASSGISDEIINGVSKKIINGISEKIDNGFNETSKELGAVSKGFSDGIDRASERIINGVTENIINKVVKKPNHLGRLFVALLIVAVAFLGYQLYQKQGLPDVTPLEKVSTEAESQTLGALQKLAVDMGATNSDSLTGKNALDLISDIQLKIDSAQTCDCSHVDDSETKSLKGLLGDSSALYLKIQKQDAFIKDCSGAKVLILKQE